MLHKQTNHDVVVIQDKKSPRSSSTSEAYKNSFKALAIVSELALDAGFSSLDAVYASSPEIIEDYCNTAHTVLRGLRKLENRNKDILKNLH